MRDGEERAHNQPLHPEEEQANNECLIVDLDHEQALSDPLI